MELDRERQTVSCVALLSGNKTVFAPTTLRLFQEILCGNSRKAESKEQYNMSSDLWLTCASYFWKIIFQAFRLYCKPPEIHLLSLFGKVNVNKLPLCISSVQNNSCKAAFRSHSPQYTGEVSQEEPKAHK